MKLLKKNTIVSNTLHYATNDYNEIMIIYHGSKRIIKEPIVKGSNTFNDYGPAFYTTPNLENAISWSCKNDEPGFVNKYVIRNETYKSFKVLDLTDKKKYSILNWLAILMHFRIVDPNFKNKYYETLEWLSNYYIDVNKYDLVIGFRADDAYFSFPKEFINGNMAFEDLEKVFMLGDLGIQYVFISNKAIRALKFTKVIKCDSKYVGVYYKAVKKATKVFKEIMDQPHSMDKTYVYNLMRKDNEK